MNHVRRTLAVGAVGAALVAALAAAVPSAQARWIFHDSAVGEAVVAPPGGTRADTCPGRLRAVAGWGRFVDVENGEDPADVELTPDARSSLRYRVWEAPAGFDSFAQAFEEDETGAPVFVDPDGTRHPARLAGAVTTPARTPLPTPRPAGGDPGRSDNVVFTTAAFTVPLSGVRPGDLLGLAPQGSGGIFVQVRAMDCRLPVLRVRVDLRPGTRDDVVRPHVATDLVPVRVFGTRRVVVRHVARVRLGEAAPVAARAPRDVDRDGRADRVYLFEQGDTDLQCLDARATVTGRTTDRVRFSARVPIATEGCAG